jgi:O-antigen biosynthesis protein
LARVLVVGPRECSFDRDGGHWRLFSIAKSLLERGWTVTYFSVEANHGGTYCERLRAAGVDALAPQPGSSAEDEFLATCEREEWDIIIFSWFFVAERLLPIARRACPGSRVILDTQDLHAVREQRAFEEFGIQPRWEGTFEREKQVIEAVDEIWVTSELDELTIEGVYGRPADAVIPCIYPVAKPSPRQLRSDLTFIGNSSHAPNFDAATWLVESVLPILRESHPMRLRLGGDDPRAIYRRLAAKDLEVVGWVPDAAAFIAGSIAMLAGVRFGAGHPCKIALALSTGTPVVATPYALKTFPGAPLVDGGPSASTFAAAVESIAADAERWAEVSAASLSWTEAHAIDDLLNAALDPS